MFSIIMVNYNGGAFLQAAIDSLAAQTLKDFELLLIDNASTDGSADMIDLSALPASRLLRETENHGFARGNNIAARQARGEWLVLLNPDTVTHPDWLYQIRIGIENNPGIVTFACTQLNLDDPTTLDGAGDAYHLFGIPWRGGFGRPVTELPEPGFCFSACGASAVYRKDVFLEAGGFDERFFCYCEDVDLGYRLQLAGYDCAFLPDAIVRHAGSGTSGRTSYFTTYHGNRNRTWLFFKNTPLPLLILTLTAHLFLLAYLYLRNRGKSDHNGLADGIKDGLRQAFKIRRSTDFRARARSLAITTLIRRMAWNPLKMSRRRCHIRSDRGSNAF